MGISKPVIASFKPINMEVITKKTVTRSAIIMCALGMAFYCYEYYLRVVPSVMSAELKQTFALSEAAFGHLAACYYYAYTPMQIPVGMMMDRFGPRRILTFACFLCAFGTYLFANTSHIHIAQIGRFLVGFGSAFAYVGILKISNVWLPQRYFAFMAGLSTTLGALGGIGGQISLSYMVDAIGWQPTLHYSIVVGVLLTFILWVVLRDGSNGKSQSDTKPLQQSTLQSQQASDKPIRKHAFSGLTEMLLSRQLWLNGFIGCLLYLPITGFAEIWAVSFLQATGMSKQDAALGSAMIFIGFALGAPLWGWASDVVQSRRIPMILGAFISAAIMALVIYEPTSSKMWMYPLLFFSGFFAGAEILIFAVSNDLSQSSVSATAAAFVNMMTMVGGMFIPPIIGKLLDTSIVVVDSMPMLNIHDYSIALSILPISLVLGGILSIILKESYRR
jgi:sugar phosphate permease